MVKTSTEHFASLSYGLCARKLVELRGWSGRCPADEQEGFRVWSRQLGSALGHRLGSLLASPAAIAGRPPCECGAMGHPSRRPHWLSGLAMAQLPLPRADFPPPPFEIRLRPAFACAHSRVADRPVAAASALAAYAAQPPMPPCRSPPPLLHCCRAIVAALAVQLPSPSVAEAPGRPGSPSSPPKLGSSRSLPASLGVAPPNPTLEMNSGGRVDAQVPRNRALVLSSPFPPFLAAGFRRRDSPSPAVFRHIRAVVSLPLVHPIVPPGHVAAMKVPRRRQLGRTGSS
uniref:Uncharacterized protein n=1 Tax=Oryza sativa subsp. japonica TaxID=39947 RepID=Q5Z576_ORYSJ|nr:hypothetical protein [Oryza sativa Japonica Group]BAD69405.1 hypothetical protein [Oryza sativa Japonica Group]